MAILITSFKVIKGHHYQRKVCMRLSISE